jgi:hypothetical protein
MNNHCAVTCPVVTEAVKAATPESKIAMAIAAIESEKISLRAAAERFGVPEVTLRRKTPTASNGAVGTEKPKALTGKDGKTRLMPATPEEIAKAWEMLDAGTEKKAIAAELGRGYSTVREWFKKDRPEAVAIGQPVMPAPVPEVKPQVPEVKPKVPDNLKKAHQREQKRIKERWLPIAEHLKAAHDLIRAEKERLCTEYAGAHGSLIMTRRWQDMAAIWEASGLFDQFAEVTGKPEARTLDGVLAELERSSRMANGWVKSIAVFTGCKPDPTRYVPEQVE